MSDRPRQGFTLIEFIAIVVLIAAFVFLAVPRSPDASGQLRSQAEQLANDIRYVQAVAMTAGARYRVDFNTANDSYQLADQGGAPIPHPATGSSAPITLLGGVNLASTTNAFLVFDGLGRPYSDAATPGTPLAADAVITLTATGATRTLRVSPETGRVVVQ